MPIIEHFSLLHSQNSLPLSEQELALHTAIVRANFQSFNLELSKAIKTLKGHRLKTILKESYFNFLRDLTTLPVISPTRFLVHALSISIMVITSIREYSITSRITHPHFRETAVIDRTHCDIYEIFFGRMNQENLALAYQVAIDEENIDCANAIRMLSRGFIYNLELIAIITFLLLIFTFNLIRQIFDPNLAPLTNLKYKDVITIINTASKFNINIKDLESIDLQTAYKFKKTIVEAHYERQCKKIILAEVFEKKGLTDIINIILDYSDAYPLAKLRNKPKNAFLSSLHERNSSSANCYAYRFFQKLKTDSNNDIPIYRYNAQQVLKNILDYAEDDTAKRLVCRTTR